MRHDACIGVLLAELHFPENRSLKDKRAPLASLRDAVQRALPRLVQRGGAARRLAACARCSSCWPPRRCSRRASSIDDIDRYLHAQEFEVSRVLLKCSRHRWDTLWDIDF